MNGKLLRRFGMFAIALAAAMAGCDSVRDDALTSPGGRDDLLLVTTGKGYTIAKEKDASAGTVSALIGEAGGTLRLGKHSLSVPAGAVTAPTLFVMNKLPGEIKVDLTATRLLPNDVGALGFLKPVRLTLSFDNVDDLSGGDEELLKILWVRPDGTYEPQQSYVDRNYEVVRANLNHFSIYTMGWGVD